MRTALFLSAICMFSVAAETQEMPLLLQEQHGSLDLPDFEFNLRPSSTQPEAWQLTDPFWLQAENAATSPLSPLPTIASPFSHANLFIFDRNPFAFDYSNSGMLYSWDSGFIAGFGARSTLPGLFSEQTAGVSASQQFGDFTLQGSVTANRYLLPRGIGNQFGIHGSASYRFSDHVSITLFGSYYNKNSFFSNAAQPYVGSSSYGGFLPFPAKDLESTSAPNASTTRFCANGAPLRSSRHISESPTILRSTCLSDGSSKDCWKR